MEATKPTLYGDSNLKHAVFFISDGTGITAETIGRSVLSQFPQVEFEIYMMPYVDSPERAHEVVLEINKLAAQTGELPFVFDTLVNPEIRSIINAAKANNLDIFEGLISKISNELDLVPSPLMGNSHSTVDSANYKARMDAVHFALDNDDGARTKQYDIADVILTGVSRSGKTPTSLYLAMQYGIRAANYPLTEDDFDDNRLPAALKPHKNKLFGLTIDPQRLTAIREERKNNSRYASFAQCNIEVRAAEAIYRSDSIPFLDVSEMSVEEIATRIIQARGLQRRI